MFITEYIASLTNVSIDTASMAVVLFSTLPLTLLYTKLIPVSAVRLRNIASIFLSSVIFLSNFDKEIFMHILVSTLYTFAGAHLIKRCMKQTESQFEKNLYPWLIFLVNFIHLLYVQWGAKRFFTGAFMMTVVKNTMFAWDFTLDLNHGIYENCTMLDYLGYIFFLPTFFVGGPFSFKHFYECQMRNKNDEDEKNDKVQKIMKKRRMIAITRSILWVILLMIFYLQLVGVRYELALTKEYEIKPFWEKILLLQLFGFASRLQYYIAWKLSETCGLIAGMGFTGENFDGLQNSNVIKTETSKNLRDYIASWNKLTAIWLKNYVYKNFSDLGFNSGTTTMFTFVISAVWHGIHPGYYLTFISGAFFTEVSRKLHKKFSTKIKLQSKPIKIAYRLSSWMITWSLINYIAAPFMVFEFSKGIQIWNHNYFIYHIAGILLYIIL